MSKLSFSSAFKSDRLPGFSPGCYFYNAIGLKDRRKRLVWNNPNPQSLFIATIVFAWEICARSSYGHFRPGTSKRDYPG